jgi:hypothetical protein
MDAGLSEGADREMHLYLTDYRSLYVGHVAEIVREIGDDEAEYVPAYYRKAALACDCWFRLFDIRRVVSEDTVAVTQELRKLRNTRYSDRPVSIYGGMVELPLIVKREDGDRYFDATFREKLIDGRFWVEIDAERVGIGKMERELRENVVGEAAWDALDPAARMFIATAESLFREHRRDPAFDFSSVVIDFAKAIELQVNLLLRRGLAGAADVDRRVNIDGRSVDLAGGALWSLGELSRAIGGAEHVNKVLKRRLAHGEWFTSSLPPILDELSALRNPAAHTASSTIEKAESLRNRILGVGTAGVLSELGRVRLR